MSEHETEFVGSIRKQLQYLIDQGKRIEKTQDYIVKLIDGDPKLQVKGLKSRVGWLEKAIYPLIVLNLLLLAFLILERIMAA